MNRKGQEYPAPPGGTPRQGVDFAIGPDAEHGQQPGLCSCGCGLKAGLGPHPGLKTEPAPPAEGATT